jgi:hypothetical protein
MDIWHLLELIKNYGSPVALVATWAAIAWVWYKRRVSWLRKEFINQVNFSLNYVVGESLLMRTLLETTAEKVWLNAWGVKKLMAAAARTTERDPFIRLDNAGDRDFINRAVLNVLSERFAETFVAASLGVPVKTAPYRFAITCEKYKDMRTLKIRVLIVEESTLEKFGPEGHSGSLKLANPKFTDRIQSLQAMCAESKADKHVLGLLELGVVDPSARG